MGLTLRRVGGPANMTSALYRVLRDRPGASDGTFTFHVSRFTSSRFTIPTFPDPDDEGQTTKDEDCRVRGRVRVRVRFRTPKAERRRPNAEGRTPRPVRRTRNPAAGRRTAG